MNQIDDLEESQAINEDQNNFLDETSNLFREYVQGLKRLSDDSQYNESDTYCEKFMVILTLIHSLCYRVAMKLNFDIKKCFEIIQKSNMSKSCLTEEIGLQSVQYYIEHFHVFEAR